MKKADLIALIFSFPIGALVALSVDSWVEGMELGRAEIKIAKRELLAEAGLFELHHKVYEEVGERAWRDHVRPEFLRRVTRETILATGTPFPDWKDVVAWVRANPERARQHLKDAAR